MRAGRPQMGRAFVPMPERSKSGVAPRRIALCEPQKYAALSRSVQVIENFARKKRDEALRSNFRLGAATSASEYAGIGERINGPGLADRAEIHSGTASPQLCDGINHSVEAKETIEIGLDITGREIRRFSAAGGK